MSNASQRNFGAAVRERERRLGRINEGEDLAGLQQAAYLGPGWDAWYGSLHDLQDAAAQQGMGFRADLSGLGRDDAQTGGLGSLNPLEQQSLKYQAMNAASNDEAQRRQAQNAAQDAYAKQLQQGNINDLHTAYEQHVLASGQAPPESHITTETDNAQGQPEAYTMRPAVPLSQRDRLLRSMPPSEQAKYQQIFAAQDVAKQEADAKMTTAEGVAAASDPMNPKRQQALEQQYRGVLQKTLSSRSGGMGLEDQKVNQALHLTALMDQNRDPKTGEYNIPKAQYAELASGLATLISPNGRPTDSMRNEIETRTAKGDLAGLVTYLTGTPVTGSTQAIFKYLRDSIDRQGKQAEANRAGYFDAIRAMAPTDLADERRQALEKSLKLNSLGGSVDTGDTIYAQDPQGNIHAGKKGTPLPQGWTVTQKPGGAR